MLCFVSVFGVWGLGHSIPSLKLNQVKVQKIVRISDSSFNIYTFQKIMKILAANPNSWFCRFQIIMYICSI